MKLNQVVFLSYAHDDDTYDKGAISELARRLERALKALTGEDLQVFIDRTSIEWGDAWRACIVQGLAASSVLIAIVTPTFLRSQECQIEIETFLAQNRAKPEHSLLPIYYLEVKELNSRTDHISKMCSELQYVDWRYIRTVGRTSITWRKAIEELATKIIGRLEKVRALQESHLPIISSEPSRKYRAQPTGAAFKGSDWLDYAVVAQAACEKEEYGLARALLLDALEHSPKTELLYDLAIVDWLDGALDTAITEFEQALAAGLDRITVLQGLGQARIERGDFEQGVEDLTTVIQHHPDEIARTYARSTRALGLGGMGRFQEALDELADTENITPDNSWLHFNRARILDWQKNVTAADHYMRSLVLNAPPLNRPKREMAQRRLFELGWRA